MWYIIAFFVAAIIIALLILVPHDHMRPWVRTALWVVLIGIIGFVIVIGIGSLLGGVHVTRISPPNTSP
jgi:uncharacterized membrane protein